MQKGKLFTPIKVIGLLGLLVLSSCRGEISGFDFDYGWGPIEVEVKNMRFQEEKNVKRTVEGVTETIPWGRYFLYDISYYHEAYFWQELPKHHYYLKTRPSTRDPNNIRSMYFDGMINMTFSDTQVNSGEKVTGTYKILYTTDKDFLIEGQMPLYVVENKKLDLLFSIQIKVTNWEIEMVDDTQIIPR